MLDAAESLFARKGFGPTSLGEVGARAGVSRGTPSYFFGSKAGLYVAVKERLAGTVRAAAEEARASSEGPAEGTDPREVLARGIGSYVDFLAANPNYVRLVEREASGEDAAIGGASSPGARMAESLGSFGVGFLKGELERGPFRGVDARQLAASMIALCSFPFLLGGGMIRTLGIDPEDPRFLEERKEHVVRLVLEGIERRG